MQAYNPENEDIIYSSDRRVTGGDHHAGRHSQGRKILPIGSGRRTSPAATPPQVTEDKTAWFPPPGLSPVPRGRIDSNHLVERPASPPPYTSNVPWSHADNRPMAPSQHVELIDLTGPDELYRSAPYRPWALDSGDRADEFEDKFVSLAKHRRPPKQIRGPFMRTVGHVQRERPPFGYNVCLDLECISSKCQHCTYLRHRGDSVLRTKLGRRIVDPRLWKVKLDDPGPDWAFIEDKRKLLPLQASYVQGWTSTYEARKAQMARAA